MKCPIKLWKLSVGYVIMYIEHVSNFVYSARKTKFDYKGVFMKYCLFNPLANNHAGTAKKEEIIKKIGDAVEIDVTKKSEEEMRDFVKGLDKAEDTIYLVGGDGTLQKFANCVYGEDLPTVVFCPAGTGNDFCNDLGKDLVADGMVEVNKYIKRLPSVTINGKTCKFINGIGYGIDGVCCEVADEQRGKSDKPINYTAIAVKQCLYKFKRRSADVTVDGVTKHYKNVWICPTMNGKFYGGGMMVAPAQNRLNEKNTVTVVVAHTASRLRMLITFPGIFTGKHVNSPIVDIIEGKEVTVSFSRPCALQIDGETVRNVSSYTVKTED